MAVINYDLVYRDGAIAGAPVTRFILMDFESELPSGNKGDLAFTKDTNRLFINYGGGWVLCFNGGQIYDNITIYKQGAMIEVYAPGPSPIRCRFLQRTNAANFDMTFNAKPNADFTDWIRDDPNKAMVSGTMVSTDANSAQAGFYVNRVGVGFEPLILAQSNPSKVTIPGQLYEQGRASALGQWIDVPFNSNNFYAPGAISWTFDQVYYSYCLIGKTCHINLAIYNSTLTVPASSCNTVIIYFPSGILAGGRRAYSTAVIYDAGWKVGSSQILEGYNHMHVGLNWPGFAYFTGGTFYIITQISFSIQ